VTSGGTGPPYDAAASQRAYHVDLILLLPFSADWVHPSPCHCLSGPDVAVRDAVAHRLECKACEPQCRKAVDAGGLHGSSCRRSGPKRTR